MLSTTEKMFDGIKITPDMGITTFDAMFDISPIPQKFLSTTLNNACLLEMIDLLNRDLEKKSDLLLELQTSCKKNPALPLQPELVFCAELKHDEYGLFYDLYAHWAHVDPLVLDCADTLKEKGLGLLNARNDWFYNNKLWFTVNETGPDYFVQYLPLYQPSMAINQMLPVLQIKRSLLKSNIAVEMRIVKNDQSVK